MNEQILSDTGRKLQHKRQIKTKQGRGKKKT
jgi:hypothetical protein